MSFEKPFDGNVYHYTSAAALHGIVTSRTIFCTDYRQLNDTTELSTGFEVIEAAMAAQGEEAGISRDDIDDILDHLALLRLAPPMHISMFAASFSLHGNDLSQWRSYAPSSGVSIGFRLPALQRLAIRQRFVCGPVQYLGADSFSDWLAEQIAAVQEGLKESAINEDILRKQACNEPADSVELMIQAQRSGSLERWIGEVAGLVKNADFRSEAEWRCVFVHRLNTTQNQKPFRFRSSGAKVIRFVELDLSPVDLNELIDRVIIGPGPTGRETFAAVADVLRSVGVHAEIEFQQHAVR